MCLSERHWHHSDQAGGLKITVGVDDVAGVCFCKGVNTKKNPELLGLNSLSIFMCSNVKITRETFSFYSFLSLFGT